MIRKGKLFQKSAPVSEEPLTAELAAGPSPERPPEGRAAEAFAARRIVAVARVRERGQDQAREGATTSGAIVSPEKVPATKRDDHRKRLSTFEVELMEAWTQP